MIYVILSLIFIIFTSLKISYISRIPFWLDEGLTLYHVTAGSFSEMIYSITHYEMNPFLFFWVCRSGIQVLQSTSHWALRATPFIFSILAPMGLYFLYKKCFKDEVGAAISAGFLYLSAFFTFMTCDARAYSQTIFFIIMGTLAYFKMLEKEKYSFLLFCLFWIGAVNSHFLAFAVLIILLIHYIYYHRGDSSKDFYVAFVCVVLSLLPEMVGFYAMMEDPIFHPGNATFFNIAELFFVSLTGFTLEFPHMAVYYLLCAFSAFLVFLPLVKSKENRDKVILFIALFIGFFLTSFLLSMIFKNRLFSMRHMVLVLPFYAVLLAWSITSIKISWLRTVLICGIILVNFSSTDTILRKPLYQRNDFQTVARVLRERMDKDDAVVLVHGYQEPLLLHYLSEINRRNFYPIKREDANTFSPLPLAKQNRRIWLILSSPNMSDPDMTVYQKIFALYKVKWVYKIHRKNEFNIDIVLMGPK